MSLDIYPRGQMQLWEEATFLALTDLSQKWRSNGSFNPENVFFFCSSQKKIKSKAWPGAQVVTASCVPVWTRNGRAFKGRQWRLGSCVWVNCSDVTYKARFLPELLLRKCPEEKRAMCSDPEPWAADVQDAARHTGPGHTFRRFEFYDRRPLSRPCWPFLLAHTPSGFWKSTVLPCELELEQWILHLLQWTLTRKQNSHKPEDEQPCVFQPRLLSVWLTESQRDLADW